MVSVYCSPAGTSEPAVRVLSAAGGEFISIELDSSLLVTVPCEPEDGAIYARKLSLMLAQAADRIEESIARAKAAARREANAYAEAQAEQAIDAMLGRAV
jgi:hypothetical protein